MMAKRIVFFICLLAFGISASAQEWTVATIPDSIQEKYHSVVRLRTWDIKLNSISSVTTRYKEVVTILNSKAKHHAYVGLGYDKNTSIKLLETTIYDKSGKQINQIKKSEFIDNSYISGFSLYEDNRVKHADVSQNSYPYTVEFEYEIHESFLYRFPTIFLFGDEDQYIESLCIKVEAEPSLMPQYRFLGIEDNNPSAIAQNVRQWEYKSLGAQKREPYTTWDQSAKPRLEFQTKDFEFGGYKGSMDSWQEFGNWRAQLLKDRDQLPENTVKEIQALTQYLPDERSKIKAVYEFMQSKTRYVSIQEGIGGLQPFEASLVDKVGYGDCKALSNYTIALLKTIGIKAYYTAIYAGKEKRPMYSDFVVPYSNHVIVCVPNQGDTIWLECTSQTQPFGYLGSFTEDRDALIVTENGSVLSRTPRYTQNQQTTKAFVEVSSNGSAKVSSKTQYQGLSIDTHSLDFIIHSSEREQKEYLYKNVSIPDFEIVNFSFKDTLLQVPIIEESLELHIPSFATVSGKRFFLQPNLLHKVENAPQPDDNRKNDIVISNSFEEKDSIVYRIPANMYIEYLPKNESIETPFGTYSASFNLEEGQLVYQRHFQLKKGSYSASEYASFVQFLKEVVKVDKIKVVFSTQT